MNRVLLTGARGFVGRHCLAHLVAAGFDVHAVTSAPTLPAEAPDVVWHQADLLDEDQTDALLEAVAPTSVLHLAWVTTPGEYWTSPLNDTWRQASEHLFEHAAAHGLKRAVVAGTCAEYDWTTGRCDERAARLAPTSAYSRSKHQLHVALEALASDRRFSAAWARLFFLYGPGEPAGRLVPSIITHLLRNEPAPCTEGGQRRDFMYVKDAAAALVALLQSELTGAVNIGTGQAPAIRQIATVIGRMMDKGHLIQLGARQTPQQQPPLVVANTARLRHELGFRPHWDLEAGLADTIEWWDRGARHEGTEARRHEGNRPG